MPLLLSTIDELTRADHYYLTDDDDCRYIGEYTAKKGFAYSPTNQLIWNLKKHPRVQNTPQWRYKIEAIGTAAQQFCNCMDEDWLRHTTLVPLPPSRVRDDPDYDGRIFAILKRMSARMNGLDIRELVLQRESIEPFHEQTERRLKPQALAENYYIDESLLSPTPTAIGLFDDVITTGSHFKAAQIVLESFLPGVPVRGIFLARRVPDTTDVEDLLNLWDVAE